LLLWCRDRPEAAIRDAASAMRECIVHQEALGIARPKARDEQVLNSGEIGDPADEATVLIPAPEQAVELTATETPATAPPSCRT